MVDIFALNPMVLALFLLFGLYVGNIVILLYYILKIFAIFVTFCNASENKNQHINFTIIKPRCVEIFKRKSNLIKYCIIFL